MSLRPLRFRAGAPTTANQPSRCVWWKTADIAPGRYELFSKIVAQYRDAVAAIAPEQYWITGAPITGDAGRITFVTFHDNMASVEQG